MSRIKESQIQLAVMDGLRMHPRVAFVIRSNAGTISKTYKGKQHFIRLAPPGFPDISGMLDGGYAFYMEIKNPHTNKSLRLSRDQQIWRDRIEAANGKWAVVSDVQQAIDVVDKWTESPIRVVKMRV